MANPVPLRDYRQNETKRFDGGSGGGDDGGMEARITKLEALAEKTSERLHGIEREILRVDGSIRADMHKEFTAQTWRIVGAMLTFGGLLSAAVFFIARNVH